MSAHQQASHMVNGDSDPEEEASQHEVSPVAKAKTAPRRSWYSMTFSDSEEEDTAPAPPTTCQATADNSDSYSDASTDVGDDEDIVDDLEDEVPGNFARGRSQAYRAEGSSPSAASSSSQYVPPQVVATIPVETPERRASEQLSNEDPEVAIARKKQMSTEELEAMQLHRLQKRQRQRQERREQRVVERSDRSARRWKGAPSTASSSVAAPTPQPPKESKAQSGKLPR